MPTTSTLSFYKERLSESSSTDQKEVQNFLNIFLKFNDDIMINLGHRKANEKKLHLFETEK